MEKSEREFLHRSALDAKRKNKLLKLAMGKLQVDFGQLKKKFQDQEGDIEFVKQVNANMDNVLAITNREEDAE